MNMNTFFIFSLLLFSLIAHATDLIPIEECVRPQRTADSSDDDLVTDCVTTCNLHIARLQMNEDASKPALIKPWTSWLVEIATFGVKQLSPVKKAKYIATFKYPVFAQKMTNQTDVRKWCADVESKIDQHYYTTSWGISTQVKGCLKSLSLYEGCHDRCKEILKMSCPR